MHLTFDRSLDREEVEKAAADSGDYTQDMPDRRYARLWLTPDHDAAVRTSAVARGKSSKVGARLSDDVRARYDEGKHPLSTVLT
jgi:hypothetical protein